MIIGIEQFRALRELWLDQMLIQPLRGPASGYLRSIRPRLGGMLDWVGNKFDYDIALPAELQAV
jgi:hypothetical protein